MSYTTNQRGSRSNASLVFFVGCRGCLTLFIHQGMLFRTFTPSTECETRRKRHALENSDLRAIKRSDFLPLTAAT